MQSFNQPERRGMMSKRGELSRLYEFWLTVVPLRIYVGESHYNSWHSREDWILGRALLSNEGPYPNFVGFVLGLV